MNPADQVNDVRNSGPSELLKSYELFFIDAGCIEIMEKADKTENDFLTFIELRGKLVQKHMADTWGCISGSQQPEDDDEDE